METCLVICRETREQESRENTRGKCERIVLGSQLVGTGMVSHLDKPAF